MKLLIKVTFGSILRKPNKLDVMRRTTPKRVKTGIIKENIDEPIVPITLNNPREKTHKCVRISPISEIYVRVSIQINASQQNGLLAPSKFVHKPNFFLLKLQTLTSLKDRITMLSSIQIAVALCPLLLSFAIFLMADGNLCFQ